MDILERFEKYIAFDTISSETSETYPSTPSQLKFADMMVEDLKDIGVEDAYKDEFGLVYGHIDCGCEKTIGLIAHMDTSPSLQGGCKNPRFIPNFDGKDIKLNEKYTMTVADFPFLPSLKGQDLLVTDGEHLLGADDKSGIAIIFEFAKYVLAHKSEFDYNLAISFTPDEEVGGGWKKFDVNKMKADFAYTIDGGPVNVANHDNFNAAAVAIKIAGLSVHPGTAKNIMENAASIACDIQELLPKEQVPEKTDGMDGFFHLTDIKGDCENAELHYIIRDFDIDLLEKKKSLIKEICAKVQKEHKKAVINCEIYDQYKNMAYYFREHPEGIELINKAYLNAKMQLSYEPIRGGTDGAMITYMGLPCPNLGTGGYNCHGRYEFVSVTQMKQLVEVLKQLLK